MKGSEIPTFGEALATFRTQAGLSQQKLADQLGKNRRAVAAWEGGEYLPKTKGDILELARILTLNDEETTTLLFAAGMDPSLSFWNVPYQRNPYFTGRDELFDLLDQHLSPVEQTSADHTHCVALTQPHAIKGLGGIGKTQIAVEYAYRSRDLGRYTHTFWVNAVSEEMIIASFVSIADLLPTFPARHETDQRKLVEAVKRWLERCRKRWLLIFDNADELDLVRDFLPKQGRGSIVLTTRAHAVGSLATSVEVETMGWLEGTQLLLRRAQRFEHASEEEINQAGNIVVALDHFPLALDQAGAYIEETKCSFEDYLDLYQTHRQALLAQRGMLSTDYPHSVATTWLLSFQKIQEANPAAAELLQLCSFLAPDRIPEELLRYGAAYWPASLQQAVADPLLFQQLISGLLKFSLVKRLMEEHTFSIHRLVQAVQRDRIEREMQRQWAESVVRVVNDVFPKDPQDLSAWPQCLRYLDQAQACNALIEQYTLSLIEGARLLNRAGLYLNRQALYSVAEPLLRRVISIYEQQLGENDPDTASSLSDLAILYYSQGKYSEAEPLLQHALAIHEQQLGPDHPDTALTLVNLAGLYKAQGRRFAEVEPLLQHALAIHEQQLGPDHLNTANSLNNLATLYWKQGKYAEAEPLFQHALAIHEQQLGPDHPDTASSLDSMAAIYRAQEKYAEAEVLYQRSLRITEQQMGIGHPATASRLNNLAALYWKQGKYAEAEPLFQRALVIREQQLGPDHPDTASSLDNLAALYLAQWKYTEAEPLCQRALVIREQQLGPDHPDMADSLDHLANLYQAQGKYAEAEPLFQRALAIREQQLGSDHPDTASNLDELAELYRAQRKYVKAEPLQQRALRIREQQLGAHHLDTALSLNNLACIYIDQRKYSEAAPLLRRALVIREQQLGAHHLFTALIIYNLATVYRAQGKYTEAEALFQRALAIREHQLGVEHPRTQTVRAAFAAMLRSMGRDAEAEALEEST